MLLRSDTTLSNLENSACVNRLDDISVFLRKPEASQGVEQGFWIDRIERLGPVKRDKMRSTSSLSSSGCCESSCWNSSSESVPELSASICTKSRRLSRACLPTPPPMSSRRSSLPRSRPPTSRAASSGRTPRTRPRSSTLQSSTRTPPFASCGLYVSVC